MVAIVGWALFGISGIAIAIMAIRYGGMRADLSRSEDDRDRLAAALDRAVSQHADEVRRLRSQMQDHLGDLKVARDLLDQLSESDPDLARSQLDSAIQRARAIVQDARSPSVESSP